MALQELDWRAEEANRFDLYGQDGQERLSATTLNEGIDEILLDLSADELCEMLDKEETLDLYGSNRVKVERKWCRPLLMMLDSLNDNHELGDLDAGRYDGLNEEGRAAVEAAESTFIDVFLQHYKPFRCEPQAHIVIPVTELFESMSELERLEYFGKAVA